MLKIPYIHYIDVKSNEQRQQESLYWHHYKSAGHPCSLACLIMICSLLDVTHKEHWWQNGFFHLSWKATSICTEDVKHADNVQQYFWRESNMGLLFTMSWSGRLFFLFLFTTLTGVVASGMKWRRLREFPSLTQAFITSVYYISGIIAAKICHEEVSCKNHSLRSWQRKSGFCTSHVTSLCIQDAGFVSASK